MMEIIQGSDFFFTHNIKRSDGENQDISQLADYNIILYSRLCYGEKEKIFTFKKSITSGIGSILVIDSINGLVEIMLNSELTSGISQREIYIEVQTETEDTNDFGTTTNYKYDGILIGKIINSANPLI